VQTRLPGETTILKFRHLLEQHQLAQQILSVVNAKLTECGLIKQLEKTKASMRAKVEHPFQVLKQQFGDVKVRYRGLSKNTAQFQTLSALVNLWLVRKPMIELMRA
jgi:IS5 family transposase